MSQLTVTWTTCPCKLCGATQTAWFVKHGREVVRCPACRLLTVPAGVARTDDGQSIYETDDNIFLQDGNAAYYLDETNFWSCRLKVDWLRKYLPPGARLLDAGANYGHFLKVAAETYDAVGFDLSPQAVRWSREHFQADNHVASIYDPPAGLRGPYGGVTCWDVIEHLEDPLGALDQLHALVEPRGMLFLSTPDAGSAVAQLLGRAWYYIDPVQHLNLFGRANLGRALERCGFEVLGYRSFGRYYRLRYVVDRVGQLYRGRLLRGALAAATWPFGWALDRAVYIKLGDVLGVAARRR
jgi:SAM-dependent methyltransferase